jgi:hypothetical protein
LQKVSFKLFPDDILRADMFRMFDQSPRIEIYCKDYRDILLQEKQREKLKALFQDRKYHLAVKFWLNLLDKKGLTQYNTEELIALVEECKKTGLISKTHRTKFERFIMKKEIRILGEPLTIQFAQSKYSKFLQHEDILLNTNISGAFETIRNYIGTFKKLGFYRSRRFLTSFRTYIRRIRPRLSGDEYTKIMRTFRSRDPEPRARKVEYDHFPPNFIYRFAKDRHIRELRYSKRPGWFIKKGLHKRSISTGYSTRAKEFASQQRDLFSQGKYYETIRNYTFQYIRDGTINPENKEDFKKVLRECASVSLISTEQVQILYDSLG